MSNKSGNNSGNNSRNKVINFGRNRNFKSLSEALASSHVTSSNDQIPFPQPSPRLLKNWYLFWNISKFVDQKLVSRKIFTIILNCFVLFFQAFQFGLSNLSRCETEKPTILQSRQCFDETFITSAKRSREVPRADFFVSLNTHTSQRHCSEWMSRSIWTSGIQKTNSTSVFLTR